MKQQRTKTQESWWSETARAMSGDARFKRQAAAPVGCLTLTSDGTIVAIDESAARLLGTRRRYLLGRRLVHFVHSGDRERWHRFFEIVSTHRCTRDCELRLLHIDGHRMSAHLNGTGSQSRNGGIVVRLIMAELARRTTPRTADGAEPWLRVTPQTMRAGSYEWDRSTGSLRWSTELERFCAHAPMGDMSTDTLWWRRCIHPEDLALIRTALLRAIRNRAGHVQVAYRVRADEAHWKYVMDRAMVIRDPAGRVMRLSGFVADITAPTFEAPVALKRLAPPGQWLAPRAGEAETASQALADAERFAHATIDALLSRLCVLDERGRILATNKAWRDGMRDVCRNPYRNEFRADPCTGCQALACITPHLSPRTAAIMKHEVRELLAGKHPIVFLEYELAQQSSVRWFEMRAMRFPGNGPVRFVMTHDEITDRKHAEDEQRKGAERLKRLRAHLEHVMERQSGMIARELHDELGATLTMLRLGLATTAELAGQPEAMRGKFDILIDQVDTALQVVKRVSTSLRPATLDMLGLIATIRWYVTQFSRNTGIVATLRLPDYVGLTSAASTTVFRIVQEGLTNVARHSSASRVAIHAREHKRALIVRLKDNGSGFSQGSLSSRDSFGLMGMRERAEHLGGTLALHSAPGRGTRLTLRIPLGDESERDTTGIPSC